MRTLATVAASMLLAGPAWTQQDESVPEAEVSFSVIGMLARSDGIVVVHVMQGVVSYLEVD